MKLRTITCLSIAVLALLVFVAIQGIMYFVVEPTLIDNDTQTCTRQIGNIQNILGYRISALATNTKAYATWDDTYRFAQDQNSQYIDNNYDNSAFDYLHLNLVAIVNNHSELIYYQTYDLNNQEKTETSPNALSYLASEAIWKFHSQNDNDSGIIVIDHQPMIVTSAPILTSEAEGPTVGGLLFGKFLDDEEIQTLVTLAGIKFTLIQPENLNDPETLYALVSGEATTVVKTTDDHTNSGYTLLRDIGGESCFVVQVTTERSFYQTSLYLQEIFLVLAIGMSVAFAAIMFVLMEREIVKPLTKMAGYVEKISLNPNFSPPQEDAVTEEFAVLTNAVKNTLKRKLEGMNEVSMMVAHDLRNPLAGIRYSNYMLKKRYGERLDSEGLAVLERIDDSIRYADNIVQNLLEYSAEIKLDKRKITAKELVDQTLTKLAIPNNITILNEANAVHTVNVDPSKIERVFTNLVGNAFDAMLSGGTLYITSSKQKGDYVKFSFIDTGSGLSEEAMANLWKPFFTTKAKGMGIGLSICRRIVNAHGGRFEVENEVGKGACFSVYLPIQT